MRTKTIAWCALLALALSAPALAGEYKKCGTDAQSCLNYLAAKFQKRGWVGLELERVDDEPGMTVVRVVPDSPAAASGFRVGDRLVAVNGLRFGEGEPADWERTDEAMVPGNTMTYTVARDGKEMPLEVILARMPERVMAQMIGEHMLEHVVVARARN